MMFPSRKADQMAGVRVGGELIGVVSVMKL
jgi:hypothetical protein